MEILIRDARYAVSESRSGVHVPVSYYFTWYVQRNVHKLLSRRCQGHTCNHRYKSRRSYRKGIIDICYQLGS